MLPWWVGCHTFLLLAIIATQANHRHLWAYICMWKRANKVKEALIVYSTIYICDEVHSEIKRFS